MSRNFSDLGVLARAPGMEATPRAPAEPPDRGVVPAPRRRWASRVALPAGLLLATSALLAYAARDTLLAATPVRVVPVVVRASQESTAGAGAVATVQAPGWVEPDPFPISVSALTDGVVKEVLVLEGQPVKAGDVVLRMIDDDARLALARAAAGVEVREGELAAAKAAHEAARREWDHPVERARSVAAADAMLAEATAELERLPAEIEAEQARTDELADAARRAEANVERRAVAESELVQTRLRLKAQQLLLGATKAKRGVLEARVRQFAANLEAARASAKLRIAERKALDGAAAAVRVAEGALVEVLAMCDESKLRLARTEVRAPADGVVMALLVEPGSKLMLSGTEMRSAQVLRLYDPKKLQVRVDVPIADAANVGVGQAATIVVGVLPDRSFDGVITRVVHEADIQRNTLQVKVAITNPSPELKPEMLARVRLSVVGATPAGGAAAVSSQQVYAPLRLLQREGDSAEAKAWVVDKGRGVAVRRAVTISDGRFDDWAAVSGLMPGDVIISGETGDLTEGQRVRVVGEVETPAPPAKAGPHGTH